MKAQIITSDFKVEMIEIGHKMNKKGLPKEFIASAVETAFEYEGVYELMHLWNQEKNKFEKNEIIADIQELIKDCKHFEKSKLDTIQMDDLEKIGQNIRDFKNSLRLQVEKAGGILELYKKTGIPQPSLSRFFNSTSIPHRMTLLKISKALNIKNLKLH